MTSEIKRKTFSFGGGDVERTSPSRKALSPQTNKLNVELSLEDALKVNLAIDECVRKINSYNRSTIDGKRALIGITIHLDSNRITVYEGRRPRESRPA